MADYSLTYPNEYQRAAQVRGPSRKWTTDGLLLMLDESTNASTAADTMRTAAMVTNGWGPDVTGHTASKSGTVTLGTASSPFTGGAAFCANFTGSGVLLPTGNSDFNYTLASKFSVNMRVNMNALASETVLIARVVDTSASWKGWMMTVTAAGVVCVWIINDIDDRYIKVFSNDASAILSVGAWATVGFTYDGSGTAAGTKIYVNGVNWGTSVTKDDLNPGSDTIVGGTLTIGGADPSTFRTNAKIAGVTVESRELSAVRMARIHYKATHAGAARTLAKNCGWLKGVLAASRNNGHFVCGDSTSMPGSTSLAEFLPFALKNTGLISRIMSYPLHLANGQTSGSPSADVTLIGAPSVSKIDGYVGVAPGTLSGPFSIFDAALPASSGVMYSLWTAAGAPANIPDGELLLGMGSFVNGTNIPGGDLPASTWDKVRVNIPVARVSGSSSCVAALTLYAARGGQYVETAIPIGDTASGILTTAIQLSDSASGADVVVGFGTADSVDEDGTIWAFCSPLLVYSSSATPSTQGAWFFSQHARAGSYLYGHSQDTAGDPTIFHYTVANVLADIASQKGDINATWGSTTAWGCLGINDCVNYSTNLGGDYADLAAVTSAHQTRAANFFSRWNAVTVQGVIVHPWHPLTVTEDGIMDAAWDGVAAAVDAADDYAAALNINGLFVDETPDQFLESVGVHLYNGAPSNYGEPAYTMWVVLFNEVFPNVIAVATPLTLAERTQNHRRKVGRWNAGRGRLARR